MKPSVYFLRPSLEKVKDVQVPAACLATDYFPNNYSLTISAGDQSRLKPANESQVSILDSSYSLVAFLTAPWSSVKSDMKCQCGNVDYSDKNDQRACIELEDDGEEEQDVRELSLTVFGLRILFFKSVIFNILMSARVWIS